MTEQTVALICKAMGDLNRVQIIKMLYDGDRCANDILEEMNITQPTLSHHMKILCESGLVRSKKKGKCTYYFLCCKMMNEFQIFISTLKCPTFGGEDCGCAKTNCKG